MSINAQSLVSTTPLGKITPPAIAQAQAIKSKQINSVEEALDVLKIVNVDQEVLNTNSLPQEKKILIRMGREIVKSCKDGTDVQLQNGRIIIPKEVFKGIVRRAENPQEADEQASSVKVSGNGTEEGPKMPKPVPVMQQRAQTIPLFAPPPPIFDAKKRREKKAADQAAASAGIIVSDDSDQATMLTCSEAYCILVDIAPPTGGKYVMHISSKFDGTKEQRRDLQKALDAFWKDYGENIAVSARFTSFVIQPRMILGNSVNEEVSKKLVYVYVTQGTSEKISMGKIKVNGNTVTVTPGSGTYTISSSNLEAANYVRSNTGNSQSYAPNRNTNYSDQSRTFVPVHAPA